MITLRFGTSGRLAGICRTATRITYPECPVIVANREGSFRPENGGEKYETLEAVLRSYPTEPVLVLDASVDHTSPEALVTHEVFKRSCVTLLEKQGRLGRCVGFSSGIAAVDATRIKPSATHMLEYRRQKLLQEDLFATLGCPVFLPQLFTLVGPRTYARQCAAWAQILRSRLDRAADVVLNEPHARKAWASEFQVLRCLLRFLSNARPRNVTGPFTQGDFTLHEIAGSDQLPMPPLDYAVGREQGWLYGDYLPASSSAGSEDVTDDLLQAITQS